MFRLSVELEAKSALEAVGFFGNPKVLLVGIQVAGQHEFEICIEPEDGPYAPIDFRHVKTRGWDLYEAHPDRHVIHSVARMHEQHQQQLQNAMRSKALKEAFEGLPGEAHRVFFVRGGVRLGDYEVRTVLSVDRDELARVPQIETEVRDRVHVHKSLVHAIIDEVLRLSTKALYLPDPGQSLRVLDAHADQVIRSATEAMVGTAAYCAGSFHGSDSHLLINNLAALPYEGRWGAGKIVIAQSEHPAIHQSINLIESVKFRNTLAARKLLEACGPDLSLLTDGEKIYGLGSTTSAYDPSSESIFTIDFHQRGAWELSHAGQPLLTVRDGIPHLPSRVFNEDYFKDLIERLLSNADQSALIEAAMAVANHQHGAMLVVSEDAAAEAARLSPQSWAIEPTHLSPDVLSQLTNMDGAVLVDPQGRCHAIGVILDGIACGREDPARGSRFNNAIRYLEKERPPAIVVVYSSDGGIDILPKLMPRIRRQLVHERVSHFLSVAEADPLDIKSASQAYNKIKEVSFYLSDKQCDAVNKAHARLDKWRRANTSVWIIENDLKPHPDMDESYWL